MYLRGAAVLGGILVLIGCYKNFFEDRPFSSLALALAYILMVIFGLVRKLQVERAVHDTIE
jgi:hypothetical protein